MSEPVSTIPVLDPDDPVDRVLIRIHEINRRKRADYARDGAGPFDNFVGMAARLKLPGYGPLEAIESHIASKEERIVSLRVNGRPPQNESVADTYLDRAVYACLAYACLTQTAITGDGSLVVDTSGPLT